MRTDLAPETPTTPAILAAVLSTPEKATGLWEPTTTASMSRSFTGEPSKTALVFSARSRKESFSRCLPS
jgi:hypothetical protein